MKIGYVGAGKLGMPVAAVVAQKHGVKLYDVGPNVRHRWGSYPFHEVSTGTPFATINELMGAVSGFVKFADSLSDMADRDIIFVAVQTPHNREYEGDLPVPETTADFNYSYLRDALVGLGEALKGSGRRHTVVVISTCLPGTYEREFKAISQEWENVRLIYNPYFIAMGTVIPDFLNPEFVLIGEAHSVVHGGRQYALHDLRKFYGSFGLEDRIRCMSITSAEATKVFYNTFISMKLSFANIVAEACEKVGADCDDVMGAIKAANKRLISAAYLTPGMGDGGGCHPRDNIALSHFAQTRAMSFDFFGAIMKQREEQARAYAAVMCEPGPGFDLPRGVVGVAFKPNTNIKTGSHAMLVTSIVWKENATFCGTFDRFVDGRDPHEPGVYLIGCAHDYIKTLAFPKGSIIIDPWGIVPDQEGVTVRRLGRLTSPGKLEAREVA